MGALGYKIVRVLALAIAAGVGYVALYLPLMMLLKQSRMSKDSAGLVFLFIEVVAICSAWRLARYADQRLPKPVGPGRYAEYSSERE